MIRRARQSDVEFIHGLLSHYGKQGLLLARSRSDLYDFLRDFQVAEDDSGQPVGCCALHLCWKDLCEVRSLAVLPEKNGQGWGSRLVNSCVAEAAEMGFNNIFTLTYRPDFFSRLKFEQVEKSRLPQKIWADCIHCVHFPDCDEIAMLLELQK